MSVLSRLPMVGGAAVRPSIAHGPTGISNVGHRTYVGGMWDEIGQLQFEFMVNRGLRPEHVLIDIGCGSLRGGVHFIRYLEPGNYIGIDKERELIEAGLDDELPQGLVEAKQPQLIVSAEFEFEKMQREPTYGIAQSLFTHLPPSYIVKCLSQLRSAVSDCRVYATFFEARVPTRNPTEPHDHGVFKFTRREMAEFGRESGWRSNYIGDWGHPRGQKMMEYTAP